MNYPEVVQLAKNKVARYTANDCHAAIKDCHDTLKLWDKETDYTRKLWAEIDACRDRIMVLTKHLRTYPDLPLR
jgi:hypothetical protein